MPESWGCTIFTVKCLSGLFFHVVAKKHRSHVLVSHVMLEAKSVHYHKNSPLLELWLVWNVFCKNKCFISRDRCFFVVLLCSVTVTCWDTGTRVHAISVPLFCHASLMHVLTKPATTVRGGFSPGQPHPRARGLGIGQEPM